MEKSITSRQNPEFKALKKALRERKLLFLEGRRLVEDALGRGLSPVMAAVTPEYVLEHGKPSFVHSVLSASLFQSVADTKTPQGILVFFERPVAHISKAQDHDRILILDGVQDPGNVGTLMRTAESFGFRMVIITPGTASPFSPKAVRSSMGSCLGIQVVEAGPDEISKLPHRVISLTLDAEKTLSSTSFSGRFAICLGQEASGISDGMKEVSTETVSIPMSGRTESLNVAVAGGIVMARAFESTGLS